MSEAIRCDVCGSFAESKSVRTWGGLRYLPDGWWRVVALSNKHGGDVDYGDPGRDVCSLGCAEKAVAGLILAGGA